MYPSTQSDFLDDVPILHRKAARRTLLAAIGTAVVGSQWPSAEAARRTGAGTLGQFIHYDAMVMHGPGADAVSFGGIRKRARTHADTPADGGNETTYLNTFLDARVRAMKQEPAHGDVTRVETAQRVLPRKGDLDLDPPLKGQMCGDSYEID